MARYLPREHGTYAELSFPIASGLLLGGFSAIGALFGAAAVALFLAYEPAAILLGVRGARLHAELGPGARPRLAAWLAVALLTAGLAAVRASPGTLAWALLPAGFALAALPATLSRRLKTMAGELAVAAALAALHLPLGAAAGLHGRMLAGPALVWAVAFALATLAVHALKDHYKGRQRWTVKTAPILTALACGAAIAVAAVWPVARVFALAVLPPVLATLVIAVRPVHPRYLKRVGWTLVAADAAALVVLLLARFVGG